MCIWCAQLWCTTAQSWSNNLPSYPPDNHHSSDVVCWRGGSACHGVKLWISHYSPEGEYCKYSMGQKNGLQVFRYSSAESERIMTKFGILWVKCLGLVLADFGRDLRSSDSLRGSRNFFCEVNNKRFHRFPVGQILHLNTTTSIDEAVKTFRTEFWKFYHKGSFFQKDTKIAFKISRSCDFRPS